MCIWRNNLLNKVLKTIWIDFMLNQLYCFSSLWLFFVNTLRNILGSLMCVEVHDYGTQVLSCISVFWFIVSPPHLFDHQMEVTVQKSFASWTQILYVCIQSSCKMLNCTCNSVKTILYQNINMKKNKFIQWKCS